MGQIESGGVNGLSDDAEPSAGVTPAPVIAKPKRKKPISKPKTKSQPSLTPKPDTVLDIQNDRITNNTNQTIDTDDEAQPVGVSRAKSVTPKLGKK